MDILFYILQHIFHTDCIKLWLETHNNCPMCRQPVVEEQPHRVVPAQPARIISPYHRNRYNMSPAFWTAETVVRSSFHRIRRERRRNQH